MLFASEVIECLRDYFESRGHLARMTRYTEKKKVNLLDGAQDREGDPVTIRRINGEIPDSWPKMVSLSVGEAEVSQDGTVLYDDGGTVDGHPAIGSIIGGAFTFTIWDGIEESVPYNATVQLNGEPLSLPLKQQITLLRDDPSTCGRQSNKTLKVPGFDPLPRGMKETKNKKGKPILMIGKSFSGTLEDWDFRDRTVIVNNGARVERIANCIFGETLPLGLFGYLDVFTNGVVEVLEWCDFIGPRYFGGADKAIGSARVKGSGVDIKVPEIKVIRRCRFDGLSADGIKAMGSNEAQGQLIEYCYFGPTPYITGAPPGADPHADCITIVAAKNGVKIRQCYMEMRPDRANGPRADIEVFKIVNAVRVVRNKRKDFVVDFVDVSECIFDRARNARSHNMQISGDDKPHFGPVFVRDVWMSHRQNNPDAEYIFPDTTYLAEWSNVRDLDTDKLIPRPV